MMPVLVYVYAVLHVICCDVVLRSNLIKSIIIIIIIIMTVVVCMLAFKKHEIICVVRRTAGCILKYDNIYKSKQLLSLI